MHGSKSLSVMIGISLAMYSYVVARSTICKPVSKRKVMVKLTDVSKLSTKRGLATLRG